MTEEYWTTKDGRRIAVGDMEIEHLRNTLRMILRERRQRAMAYLITTKDNDDTCDHMDWYLDYLEENNPTGECADILDD